MQNLLGGQNASNESLIKNHKLTGYPQNNVDVYFQLLNKLVTHNKELIDSIIQNSGGKIIFPMETAYLEDYLNGYNFTYTPFNSFLAEIKGKEGFFEVNGTNINIFYNNNCDIKRQRFSKIHEVWHICQLFDLSFLNLIDSLLIDTDFPAELIVKLIEKSADKATAIYLMPNDYFIQKYRETKNVQELSDYFQVSVPSVMYRLKECGLILSY